MGGKATPLPHIAVTFSGAYANTKLYWLGACVNNMPRVVTWQRNGRESNQLPRDH